MSEQETVLEILNKHNALILDDHFVYASGRHGTKYINKDALFPHIVDVEQVGRLLFRRPFIDGYIMLEVGGVDQVEPQVVIGPVVGGAILAQWAASCDSAIQLGVKAVYADKEDIFEVNYTYGDDGQTVSDARIEKVDTKFDIKRGYDKLVKGKRVLIVEDILTTGGSVKKVVQAVLDVGGIPIGVSAIVNRGGVTAEDLRVPWLCSLVTVDFDSYSEEECKQSGPCSKGVPINVELGKGRQYLERKQV